MLHRALDRRAVHRRRGFPSEERTSRKERVVRLERPDAKKYQQQQGRNEDGIYDGQPLPEHVHEDGNDQPRLQQHEHEDERPPEVTLEVEVVDKVRRGTENEEQPPDLEIDAERMLLPLYVVLSRRGGLLLPRRGMLVLICVCHGFSY